VIGAGDPTATPGFSSHLIDTVISMELTITPSSQDLERLLTEAGIGYTVVERCPHPACEVCRPVDLPSAA